MILFKTGNRGVARLASLDGLPIKSSLCWQLVHSGLSAQRLLWWAPHKSQRKWCRMWIFGWKTKRQRWANLDMSANLAYFRRNLNPSSAHLPQTAGSNHRPEWYKMLLHSWIAPWASAATTSKGSSKDSAANLSPTKYIKEVLNPPLCHPPDGNTFVVSHPMASLESLDA